MSGGAKSGWFGESRHVAAERGLAEFRSGRPVIITSETERVAVLPVDGTRRNWRRQLPDDTQRAIVDAAAGAMEKDLEDVLDVADAVVVPIQPSALDIEASVRFVESLGRHPRVRKGKLPALRVRLASAPVGAQADDDQFALLGMTGGIEVALDPATRVPLQLSGDAPYVGKVTFRLKAAALR